MIFAWKSDHIDATVFRSILNIESGARVDSVFRSILNITSGSAEEAAGIRCFVYLPVPALPRISAGWQVSNHPPP